MPNTSEELILELFKNVQKNSILPVSVTSARDCPWVRLCPAPACGIDRLDCRHSILLHSGFALGVREVRRCSLRPEISSQGKVFFFFRSVGMPWGDFSGNKISGILSLCFEPNDPHSSGFGLEAEHIGPFGRRTSTEEVHFWQKWVSQGSKNQRFRNFPSRGLCGMCPAR